MKKILLSTMVALAFLAACTSAQKSQSDSKRGMNKTEKGAVVGAQTTGHFDNRRWTCTLKN
jgi:hypothetical protein